MTFGSRTSAAGPPPEAGGVWSIHPVQVAG